MNEAIVGPFQSPWTTGDWFMVRDVRHGAAVTVVVRNGQQRHESDLAFATKREARAWLADNGYQYKGA